MKKIIFFILLIVLCFYFIGVVAGVGTIILAIISFVVSDDKNDTFKKPEL